MEFLFFSYYRTHISITRKRSLVQGNVFRGVSEILHNGQKTPKQRPPWTKSPQTEPPRQRAPLTEPPSADKDTPDRHPLGQRPPRQRLPQTKASSIPAAQRPSSTVEEQAVLVQLECFLVGICGGKQNKC